MEAHGVVERSVGWPARLPWPALVVGVLVVLLAWSVVANAAAVVARVTVPYQVDPSEGVIVGETVLLLAGVDIYAPVRPDFFTAAPYPPLFYWLLAPFIAAGHEPFPAARWLVVAAVAALAALVFGLVAWRTRRLAAAALAAALWLAPNLVAVWVARARPDLLAFAVNLVGLWLVWSTVRWDSEQPRAGRQTAWRLALAAVCFGLGFYFKHTALAAPAAAGLWLLLRRPRAAFALGGAYLVAVLAPFTLLNWTTAGGFAQHLVLFHRSWLWANYQEMAEPFWLHYWPLLGLPLLTGLLDLAARRRPDLPALYVLTALAVSLGGGTHGGNHNHLLETLLALALAAGVAFGRAQGGRFRWPGVALAAVAVVGLLLEPSGGRAWLAADLRPPTDRDRLGWSQVIQAVAADPGPVYSDNVGLLVLTRHEIRYTDPFTLAGSVAGGVWSDEELVAAVRRRHYSLIALRYDVTRLRGVPTDITPDLLAAIREEYVVAERNVMFLYRPR